jgi:riboflavin synthase
MFSGIIRATAKIRSLEPRKDGVVVAIAVPRGWKLAKGASVSVDGICSTVVGKKGAAFLVEYMPETLRLTTAADFVPGKVVNLEEPLRLGDTLDGHFVQGHIDGVGVVTGVGSDPHEITVRVPRGTRRFLAHKGSVALNGVALTIARMRGSDCTVALIPYTLAHTNLGALKKGDAVNVEVDVIARYLAAGRMK